MWQPTRKTDMEGKFFGFIVALGRGRKGIRSKQSSVLYCIALLHNLHNCEFLQVLVKYKLLKLLT
jgi:hypothetical protein